MALDQVKDGATGQPGKAELAHTGLSPAGASRRRLAASGVLMTLASQSAMAQMVCKSPSAALSGNLASRSPAEVVCLGRSPGFWKNHTSEWVGVQTGDRFGDYFFTGGAVGFSEVSCLDILSHQDYDVGNVAMHLMATYLNVSSGRITFLTQEAVLTMWREFATTGVYVPAAGAEPWTGDQLVQYLSSTQKAGDEPAGEPAGPADPKGGKEPKDAKDPGDGKGKGRDKG
jgi:hypothetical protein